MAAEALLGVVFENLVSLAKNEFATLSGIKGKTEKLSTTLDLIKAVLEDAEEKQVTDRAIKVWLKQLKDAVYVLDDILDECSIESHRLQVALTVSFKPKNIMFRHRVGSRLKEINERFDQIAKDKNKFLLREGVRESPNEVHEWRQTSSTVAQVYGRDEDKEKVVDFLLNQAQSSDFLSVYPIVGLGGVGKTTLAQFVYNDERVSTHFNIKIWICVAENFSVKSILCSIIESITEEKPNISLLDVMVKRVQKLLQGGKYLLVLDDVWKGNQQSGFELSQDKWNKLKSVLLCGSKGASILVTTRDEDVAAIMGTHQAHQLSVLSDDDCWLLFKQCAFGQDRGEREDLVEIGKDIARKCRGSPLAARALGGMMFGKNEKKQWLEVQRSQLLTLPYANDILPVLRLSYFHLSPTLKQCFAFCAIFPKDTVIKKEELIHLWMANGFISSRENLEVEDVGTMIWKELYQKSFFQDMKTDDLGDIISFKMHDLIHDLAQSIMEEECMILDEANINHLAKNTHHVVFGVDNLSLNERAFDKVESLRTLYQLLDDVTISGCFPAKFSLRVLRTSSLELSSLQNLIHLRYLELTGFMDIETLPDSICSLHKLEILKLTDLYELKRLPEHLSDLENLRHLIISGCNELSHMFPNIRKLSCLRTLSVYIVESKRGHSLAELRDLNLGRELRIKGLENVGSVSEAEAANLKCKEDLKELCLSWGDLSSDATKDEQVFEALQPHSNLKMLTINRYKGLHFPSWIGNNTVLSNLVDLTIDRCRECRQLPSLGKLPSLRKLSIDDIDVQYLDDDECYDGVEVKAFPSLEQLSIYFSPNLERLLKVEGGEMFPCLSELTIDDCPKLVLPCIPYLKRLRIDGCNNELLMSISSINGLIYLDLYNGSEDVTSFPQGMMTNLTSLKCLKIFSFPKLKELPNELVKLSALEELEIWHCGELESFPEQGWEGLRSLRTLEIRYCEGLRSLPEQGWEGLRSLKIDDCGGLRSLPNELVKLSVLEKLTIWGCGELKSFPEQGWEGLRSLRTLQIGVCGGLRSLPDGVRHLTSLEDLWIVSCRVLEKRCEKETGEDWHKIAHVPKVSFNIWD